MQFLTFRGEFFAFLTLLGWIFCFFSFKGEFFAFFPLRINSLQFLLFKGETFAIFTFLRYFLGDKDKITFVMVNCFKFFFFYFSDLGFSIWNFSCVLFCHKLPVFFWVICWHFLSFKRVFFTIFTFLGFFGMKMDKKFSCNGECFKI